MRTHRMPLARIPTDRIATARMRIDRIPIDRMPNDRMPIAHMPAARMPIAHMPTARMPAARMPIAFSVVVIAVALVAFTRSASAEPEHVVAGEVNVLWPFFPGGLSEMKVLVPTNTSGDAFVGLWSDFGNRAPLRDDTYGKVATLALKVGYRQQLAYGLHVELGFTVGWRHEAMRPNDDPVIDDLIARAWPMFGYQRDLSDRFYVNARGGGSVHLYRSSHADIERKFVPAFDVNLGVRL